MTLAEVVDGLDVASRPTGTRDVSISGIAHDSRRVEPGDLFVAWGGERFDGRRFVSQALERGAVAVLAAGDALEPLPREVPWLVAEDPRALMAPIAARVYGHPDRELQLIGITGTNGKTTVTRLVARMLDAADLPSGELGTLGYFFRGEQMGFGRTTPEASDLMALLRRMVDDGARAAAMEVSSHALDQGRVSAARYDVAVFTNLTRDHFDYHGDFEGYFAAKRRLFDLLKDGGRAVVGCDDQWGARLVDELGGQALTFGDEGDVAPLDVDLDVDGARGTLETPRGPFGFETPLVGRFNLLNLMAAVAVGEALELDRSSMRNALRSAEPVDGRMHRVAAGQSFPVFIDFAHTDGALTAALTSLKEVWDGDVIAVFGCGGDKDQGKRPLMGQAAARDADVLILTDDNPRREASESIHEDVLAGLDPRDAERVIVIADRRQAIAEAIRRARETGAAVLVAGKGHERYQIIGDDELPFWDRQEVEQALAAELGDDLGTAARD